MRKVAIGIALLLSGTAIAQTGVDADANADMDVSAQTDPMTDTDMTADTEMSTGTDMTAQSDMTDPTHSSTMHSGTTMAANLAPASGAIVQPGNANPEHDARGIAVISAPAVVPAGWNGITGTAVGGPLVDPATGETVSAAEDSYPACTATVTDNCLQTYERGRSST